MKYYRVKPEFDNKSFNKRLIYVGGELLTEKECKRYDVNTNYCEIIEEKPKNTYFFFGARFSVNYK